MIEGDRFLLDNTPPNTLSVYESTPEGSATKFFSVIADYGWAEKTLCGLCYKKDANDIAYAIGKLFDIPVTEAE